jgi:hypothetical protein
MFRMKKKLIEYQIKNRYLPVMLLACFVVGSFLGVMFHDMSTVSAIGVPNFVGFEVVEGGGSGQQFPIAPKTSILNSALCSGSFVVSTTAKLTGANGFLATGTGYWNFTYQGVLTGFKLFGSWGTNTDVHTSNMYFYFYNKTLAAGVDITTKLGSAANLKKYTICDFAIHDLKTSGTPYSDYEIQHVKSDGTWTSLYLSGAASGWDYAGYNITNEYGYCTYFLANNGITVSQWDNDTVCNTSAVIAGYRIDRCYISGTTVMYGYLDDVTVTTSNDYTGVGSAVSPCGEPAGVEMGTKQPSGYPVTFAASDVDEVEWKYDLPIKGDLWGIRMFVGADMFNAYPGSFDTGNVIMYLNGASVGAPSCIYAYEGFAVIQWLFTNMITLDEPSLVFEVHNSMKYSGNNYWSLCFGPAGLFYYSTHAYDMAHTVLNGYLNGEHTYNQALYYSFFVANSGTLVKPTEYTHEYLSLDGEYGTNVTGQMFARFVDPVAISGTVTDLSTARSIRVYCGTTLEKTFSIEDSYDFNFIYFPTQVSAHYNVSLMHGNTFVTHVNFVVTNDTTAYQYCVVTIPVISHGTDQYAVYYRYFNPDGNSGVLAAFLDPTETDIGTSVYNRMLTSNTSLTLTYSPTSVDWQTYWRLFTVRQGEYYEVGRMHVHYTLPSNAINEIYTVPSSPVLESEFQIKGHHRFPGSDVRILLNGLGVGSVSTQPEFSVSYTIHTDNTYTLVLRWYLSNGSYIDLDTYVFGAGSGGGSVSNDYAMWSIFAGVGLVLGFGFSPVVMFHKSKFFEKSGMMVILLFALCGLGLAIYFQLLPFWLAFLIGLVCAAFIALSIYKMVGR